jgi:predicted dehydrogenase
MKTAAIVGCGDIAGGYDERARTPGVFTHAGAYRARHDQVSLVACAEPDATRRRRFQETWNVDRAYESIDEMLADIDADIISVCSPDQFHADHLSQIIRSGRARVIWAEKPLTTNADHACAIVGLALEAGIGVRLTNQRRWDAAHNELAAGIRRGVLGRVTAVTGFYVKGLTHIGTTMINTLRLLVGEIVQVQALEPFVTGCYPDDSSLSAVLWFDAGVCGTVRGVDGEAYRYSTFEIDIVGTEGRARVLANGDRIEVAAPGVHSHYNGFNELQPVSVRETGMSEAMLVGLDRMLAAFDQGNEADVSEAREGVRDLTIVDAVRRSAAAGGTKIRTDPR